MVDTQPTILIKKADGTTERITLAELKARQAKPTPPPVATTPVVEPILDTVSAVPQIESPHGLVIGPVEKKVVVASVLAQDQITQAPLKAIDLQPMKHEEVPESPHAQTVVVPTRTDEVSEIIASLSFKVPAEFESRLRSGVQLRVKDIRSEDDTRDLCLKSGKDGGLGLTVTQAEELIAKTHPTAMLVAPKNSNFEILKKADKEAAVEKFVSQTPIAPSITDLITPKKAEPQNTTNPNRSNSSQSFKPMVSDVKHKPVAMSPLDEIQYFSLLDLRRLSSQPSEAVSRLRQKFVNLKEESYVLFIQAWSAWRNSPLYQNYIEMIDNALTNKFSLNAVLDSREKISLVEIEALIKMEKELGL